jgi:biofilm PGA synthesis N-glycosyltransferase PgaC
MFVYTLLFWLALFLVFYAYLGYGLLLYALIKLRRKTNGEEYIMHNSYANRTDNLPKVTIVVAAYNEASCIAQKITNTLALQYPADKLHFLFVTDGSSDNTPDIVRQYPRIELHHSSERRGKIAAVHRIMPHIKTPIVVFTDANTFLNPEAIVNIARHYADPKIGAVAGEKRIANKEKDSAEGAGEGIYWKYESALKRWDSELYSVVGAAGELFSIRTDLYEAVPSDTIIEDFYMTLRIAQRGYRVIYEPQAYAVETASASVNEELKRKIRIAAGGIQAILRLLPLLNPFKYGVLSFQYISHRVLRWTLAPLALPIIFVTNLYLAMQGSAFYKSIFALQCLFYIMALVGYLLEKRQLKFKLFFVPYYFCLMNYAVYRGMWRIAAGTQSVVWEKAKRADE